MRRTLLVFAICVSCSIETAAQLVVIDPAVLAKNIATAATEDYLLDTERQQHRQLQDMARRLSLLTTLTKYVVDDPPRWAPHGLASLFASGYIQALDQGDLTGTAYLTVSHPLLDARGLGPSAAGAQRAFDSRLATVQMTDAAVIAATHDTGLLRFNGLDHELAAIDALEAQVIDPSDEDSATAVIDKISGAMLIAGRQRQARVQLLSAALEQLLIDTKRARDVDAGTLNMQLTTWRDGETANEAFVAGTGDALRTWRQP